MFFQKTVAISAMLALANGQAVLLKAQGAKGSPASLGLQINTKDSKDFNFISSTEINANVVNECGRTNLAGNIDIGANTEDQLGNKTVTSVTKGSKVAVTFKQVNAAGAGPFTCDMDQQGNALATGQTNLTVKEVANKNGIIALQVTMPSDMACIGASTGNVCTVRCINQNSFGGCFAVQQTDITPNQNSPGNILTAAGLKAIDDQVLQDQKDFPGAAAGIASVGQNDAAQGVAVVEGINKIDKAVVENAQKLALAGSNNNANTGNGNNRGNGRGGNNANNRGGNGNGRFGNNGNAFGNNGGFGNNNRNKRAADLRWAKRAEGVADDA